MRGKERKCVVCGVLECVYVSVGVCVCECGSVRM